MPLPLNVSPDLIDLMKFFQLVEQAEIAASYAGGRHGVSDWICANTRNPRNPNLNWSFAQHEFQKEIVDSQSPFTAVLKASQLGISEVMLRVALALMVKFQGQHAIYTLPDAGFARMFSASRVLPVMDASPRLRAMIGEVANTGMIQIGKSMLHFAGTHSEKQSISTPASMLFHDESSYSRPSVLGTFQSRLNHVAEGEEIVYSFSTPLLPKQGIHKEYLAGTREHYAVYHAGCGHWVIVSPMKHYRLLRSVGELVMEAITPQWVSANRDRLHEIYIECPHCKKAIDWGNLSDPRFRAWVPEVPGARSRSFNADVLVLPAIRTPRKVFEGRERYRSTEKWLNFDIGVPADSADNRISEVALDRAFSVSPSESVSGIRVFGMDVGKTCHLIEAAVSDGVMVVERASLVRQDGDNNAGREFCRRYVAAHARQGVIDAAPDLVVAKYARSELPMDQVWGCYFVTGRGRSSLDSFHTDEKEGVLKVRRTQALGEFAADFNKGVILFKANEPEQETLRKHLRSVAQVSELDNLGEEDSRWVSVGEDHYFFALFYAWLAWKRVDDTLTAPVSAAFFQRNVASRIRMRV